MFFFSSWNRRRKLRRRVTKARYNLYQSRHNSPMKVYSDSFSEYGRPRNF